MTIKRVPIPFDNQMSREQTILGWIYLPLHMLLIPLLLQLLAQFTPTPMTDTQVNLAYYAVGVLFVLCVMLRFLRRGFDVMLDRPGYFLVTLLMSLSVLYVLNFAVSLVLMPMSKLLEDNPNNAAIMDMATGKDYGAVKAMAIFLAPLVEEVLYRGVVFGSIRTRSRLWAYVVSVLLFSLAHVWGYAITDGSAVALLYTLQYIPVSIALTWAYERSGSLWGSIFFHMGYNALSFEVLHLLENL